METIVSAGELAAKLGLSPSQTRRCARIYEAVFGALGRDARHRRILTLTAADRIAAAHQTVDEGRAVSLEAALVTARDGELPAPAPARGDVLAVTLGDRVEPRRHW